MRSDLWDLTKPAAGGGDQPATEPQRDPAPRPANLEVLDLGALVERCMGNLDLVERILRKFEERFESDLAELEMVLAEKDAVQVARVAHRMKGTSATASAVGLQQVAAEIEQMGRSNRLGEIPAQLDQLRGEWARYLDQAASATLELETH